MAFGIALVAVLPVLGGCGPPGKSVSEPQGIITLAPHLTETVFALGQGARVIAVGSFCDYPPEINVLPRVGGYIDPDLEKIALLRPGLLIVPGKNQQVTEFATLKGIPILNINMDSMTTIDAGIAAIGERLGCPSEADRLRARIREELDAVRKAVKDLPRPKTLLITMRHDHNLNTLYTANRNSFVAELADCAGGDNVYADAPQTYIEASKETLVVKAPEVIIEFHAGEKLDQTEQAKFIADWAPLPSLPAVRNRRVHLMLESHALRPGPRVAEIARRMAALLHPETEASGP